MRCTRCLQLLSLEHLVECQGPIGVAFRVDLQRDLLALLSSVACTAHWLRAHHGQTLARQLLSIFPCPAPVPSQHLTRMLCDAFTRSQACAASRLLGFPSAEDGKSTLLQVRLLCLKHIDSLFRGLKRAAQP
jgi:hypothetical protein